MKLFRLYFDTHRSDGLIAEVEITDENGKVNTHWYEQVFLDTIARTEYYGDEAIQPKFVITGTYVNLRSRDNKLWIT